MVVSELAWVVVLLSIMGFGMKGGAPLILSFSWFGVARPGGYVDGVDVSMISMLMVLMGLMMVVVFMKMVVLSWSR